MAAASEDPRFPPIAEAELGSVTVEVSVLTVPVDIGKGGGRDLQQSVRVGTDGLIVSRGDRSGLLLPQVATEFGFDAVEFLSQACMKAGLPPDAWLEEGTRVQAFQAEVFGEAAPRGAARRAGT